MFGRPKVSNPHQKGDNDSPHIDVVSSKLNELSIEERSKNLHELHGVADHVVETTVMIRAKIDLMTKHLCTLSSSSAAANDCVAYKRALELSPQYVERLKIRFLRAMKYNSQDAAVRMISFFKRKLELYGEGPLVRDLILNKDLTTEEQQAIQDGIFQLLPQRDRAGRATILICGKMTQYYPDTKSVMRCLFYFFMATSQDKESQLNGTVGIYYGIGQTKTFPGRPNEYIKTWDILPFRTAAIHYCKDSSVLDGAVQFICKAFESKLLCRMRFHVGTHMECIYNLMTFGIPREAIPIREDGSLDLDNHRQILRVLRYREEQALAELRRSEVESPLGVAAASAEAPQQEDVTTTTTTMVLANTTATTLLVPGPNDILMGRGRHPKSCTGALRLHNLLMEHRDEYEATPRAGKARIATFVLEEMKKAGCRFLSFGPGGFMECDDSAVRDTISHRFRNLRTKNKKGGISSTGAADGTSGTTTTTAKARKRNLD